MTKRRMATLGALIASALLWPADASAETIAATPAVSYVWETGDRKQGSVGLVGFSTLSVAQQHAALVPGSWFVCVAPNPDAVNETLRHYGICYANNGTIQAFNTVRLCDDTYVMNYGTGFCEPSATTPGTCPATYTLDPGGTSCSRPDCPANSTRVNDTCTCDAGYHFDAGGACVTCPANSTWDGATCACDLGYHVDGTGACVACADPNSTWNGAMCACNAGYVVQNGVCVPPCGAAQCIASCSGEAHAGVEPPLDVDLSFTKECPALLAGSAGVALKASAEIGSHLATCADGCKSSEQRSVQAEVTVLTCSGRGVKLAGSFSTTSTTTYPQKCDDATCSTICDTSASCEDDAMSWSAAAGPAWKFVYQGPKAMRSATSPVRVLCHADANATVGVKYDGHDVTNTNFTGACDDCHAESVTATVDAQAKGACGIVFGKQTTPQYVPDIFTVAYSQELGRQVTTGKCGDTSCWTSKISGSLSFEFSPCVNLYGRGVKLKVEGKAAASLTGSSCTGVASGLTNDSTLTVAFAGTCH